MRSFAVINFKGGTGKTSTVINLGAGLALRGKRVLLVDTDAQGSIGLSLGLSYNNSLADALTDQASPEECIVSPRPGLDVLPSDRSLLVAQRVVSRYVNWQKVLGEILEPLEQEYDYIFVDCSASITFMTINAMVYAQEFLIPTQIEYLSLIGLRQVMENLSRARFPGRPQQEILDLGITAIIPTMFDVRMRQSRRLLAQLRQMYGRRVAHPIRINVRVSESPCYHQTIFEYAPRSRGAFDYGRLVEFIMDEDTLLEEAPIGLVHPFQPTLEEPMFDSEEENEVMPGPEGETSPTPGIDPRDLPAASLPRCPYCKIPLDSLQVAGYLVHHCGRCGYQKQTLMRDLRDR
jgi:chromosome partitioning protein